VFVNAIEELTHPTAGEVKLAVGLEKILILLTVAVVESHAFFAVTFTVYCLSGRVQELAVKTWNIESTKIGIVHVTLGEPSPKSHV
jgi:hypothetical protein